MILIVDNYDSFTYNLAHLLRMHGEEVRVARSDRITVPQALALRPRRIVLSPGPGRPEDRGISIPLILGAAGRVPVLGVCLGHQAIGRAFGARIVPAPDLVHGKTSPVHHGGQGLFAEMPDPLFAMRYHSLVVERASLPAVLEVTAWLADGPRTIMGLRHRTLDIEGVQFHPESFMTADGPRMIDRFLSASREAST